MQKTYLFYDLETSGLSKSFDQVFQFAAIRTDLDLKEIERYSFEIALNSDVTPSPYALITHRIPLETLLKGLSELEGISKIHEILNTPGTISLGYNTLNFDDEFLRFSFYRNLLPPYTHQYAQQCGRSDIFPITLLYFLYQKEALSWPEKEGRPSLKLELINAENALFEGRAHDAMVDVEVTLALARKLHAYSEVWEYAMGYFNKQEDQNRLMRLRKTLHGYREAIAVSSSLGVRNHFQARVVGLGSHKHYKNQTLWLRLDQPELMTANLETIPHKTWVLKKRLGEPCFLLPCVERFLSLLDRDVLEIVEENRNFLLKNPEIFKAIVDYYSEYQYPEIENIDVDAGIYQFGFMNDIEQNWCQKFHAASLKNKVALLDSVPSKVLEEQAIRILGRNFFDDLPEKQKAQFNAYLDAIRSGKELKLSYKGEPRLTCQAAMSEIKAMRQAGELDQEQAGLLNDLESYLRGEK